LQHVQVVFACVCVCGRGGGGGGGVYVRVLPLFLAAFLGCICSYIHVCEYECGWSVCACVANISGSVFRLYLCVYIYVYVLCVGGCV